MTGFFESHVLPNMARFSQQIQAMSMKRCLRRQEWWTLDKIRDRREEGRYGAHTLHLTQATGLTRPAYLIYSAYLTRPAHLIHPAWLAHTTHPVYSTHSAHSNSLATPAFSV